MSALRLKDEFRVYSPCPGGRALVMLYISFSLGVSESMKDSAEGVISVTRSSRAYRDTQTRNKLGLEHR